MIPTETVQIVVIYDNRSIRADLKDGKGFSAYVSCGKENILFDAGGDGEKLIYNMEKMEIDPRSIQRVFLSHAHPDHLTGLGGIMTMGVRPVVYLTPSFPQEFKQKLGKLTKVIETQAGEEIVPFGFSTGELSQGIPEQAAVFNSRAGLVVLTGCAHPGISELVAWVKELSPLPINLLCGGFHLKDKTDDQIVYTVSMLRRARIHKIAPCHCTGENAMQEFRKQFGFNFVEVGVGARFSMG